MTEYRDIHKIIIVGMGCGWNKTPKEGEIWGINSLILKMPLKRLFLMHDIDIFLGLEDDVYKIRPTIEEVNKAGIPVMMFDKHKLLPNSVKFPLADMPFRYFTSSFAYMVALAIHEGATSIDLYGVPLALKLEYREQRACLEYWIGYARGKGIDAKVFGLSSLFGTGCQTGIYGYDYTGIYQKVPSHPK